MFKVIVNNKLIASFVNKGDAITYCHQKGIGINNIIEEIK